MAWTAGMAPLTIGLHYKRYSNCCTIAMKAMQCTTAMERFMVKLDSELYTHSFQRGSPRVTKLYSGNENPKFHHASLSLRSCWKTCAWLAYQVTQNYKSATKCCLWRFSWSILQTRLAPLRLCALTWKRASSLRWTSSLCFYIRVFAAAMPREGNVFLSDLIPLLLLHCPAMMPARGYLSSSSHTFRCFSC